MAIRLQHFLLTALLSLCSLISIVHSQALKAETGPEQIFEPSLERRDISAAAIDSENFELGAFTGFMNIEDFGSSSISGARLSYHISEDFFFEAVLGKAKAGKTSFEKLAGNIQLLTDKEREFNYYNALLGYNLFHGEAFIANKAFNSSFYLVAGAGNVDFAGDKHSSISFGVGYRLLCTDWLSWRIDMRDQMFDLDILGANKTTHNLELHTGIAVFF